MSAPEKIFANPYYGMLPDRMSGIWKTENPFDRGTEYTRTDLSQASVAAALEAAANAAWLAGPSQYLAQEELSDIGKERRDMAMRCEAAIRALITDRDRDALAAHVAAEVAKARAEDAAKTFYIDCEFDGHNGPLLSIAMARQDGYSLHVKVDAEARDPWVIANVMSVMDEHQADVSRIAEPDYVGHVLRDFIGDCRAPTIIADSPVDIARFCRAVSTGVDGGWASADYAEMRFIVRNVDCYPTALEGAVQHNAWWDAMALRAALAQIGAKP